MPEQARHISDLVEREKKAPAPSARPAGAPGFQAPVAGLLREGGRTNDATSSARAKGRFAQLRGKVDQVHEQTAALDAGVRDGRASGEVADTSRAVIGKDGKPTTTNDFRTSSAFGALLASQVDNKELIGSADTWMGSRKDALSVQSKHLEAFEDTGHSFITPWVHGMINKAKAVDPADKTGGWGGWGADANFVAPVADAEKAIVAASKPGARGIFDLEKDLGIPAGQWVKGCAPDYGIWRYVVKGASGLGLRAPSGGESGAYGSWWKGDPAKAPQEYQEGLWRPGGKTEGGKTEAVIDRIDLADLKDKVEMTLETRMAANTKAAVEESA